MVRCGDMPQLMWAPDLQYGAGDGLPVLDHRTSRLGGDAACIPGLHTPDNNVQPASSQPHTPLPSQLTKVLDLSCLFWSAPVSLPQHYTPKQSVQPLQQGELRGLQHDNALHPPRHSMQMPSHVWRHRVTCAVSWHAARSSSHAAAACAHAVPQVGKIASLLPHRTSSVHRMGCNHGSTMCWRCTAMMRAGQHMHTCFVQMARRAWCSRSRTAGRIPRWHQEMRCICWLR